MPAPSDGGETKKILTSDFMNLLLEKAILIKILSLGRLGGSVVERLPLAQVMIPGSQDRVPHQAPCREPASPPACVSASVSLMNKYIIKILKKIVNGNSLIPSFYLHLFGIFDE